MVAFGREIIERLKIQDSKTQKEVFKSLYAPLYRVCLRYVVGEAEAEDCLMTGFFKIFKSIDRFDWLDEKGFEKWCKRIVVNESLTYLRKNQTFMSIIDDEVYTNHTDSEVFAKMESEEIYKGIMKLPYGYRTVLNLFAIEGYSHQEIASMLNISESTSKTQYLKAKKKLKMLLERKENHGIVRSR